MGALNTVSPVLASVAIAPGEVIRILSGATGNRAVLAQANAPASIQAVIGVSLGQLAVAPNGLVVPAVAGPAFVLLEAALAPVNGQTLYVSAAVAGRATNVMPGLNALPIGVIHDASMYALKGGVICDLQLGAGAGAASGASMLKFSGILFIGAPN